MTKSFTITVFFYLGFFVLNSCEHCFITTQHPKRYTTRSRFLFILPIKTEGIQTLPVITITMENSESGDDLGHTFLTTDPSYIVQSDDMDDDGDPNLTAENTDDSNHDSNDKIGVPLREQDRFLPIANVAKIMKKAIPETGKIAKDARECVQECVSEFISFITSEASDRCHMEKRKTINGEDILFAMTTLGFDNYVEPLKLYLQKYREATKGEKVLQPAELVYEDIQEEQFNTQTITGNILNTNETGQGDTVIYAYPQDIQQFQLS